MIMFCIDCSPSMLELYEDPRYEDVQTCKLFRALEAAMQIQKRKVLVGPNDSVGIMLFNTVSLRYIPLTIRRDHPKLILHTNQRPCVCRPRETRAVRPVRTSRRARMCISQ